MESACRRRTLNRMVWWPLLLCAFEATPMRLGDVRFYLTADRSVLLRVPTQRWRVVVDDYRRGHGCQQISKLGFSSQSAAPISLLRTHSMLIPNLDPCHHICLLSPRAASCQCLKCKRNKRSRETSTAQAGHTIYYLGLPHIFLDVAGAAASAL